MTSFRSRAGHRRAQELRPRRSAAAATGSAWRGGARHGRPVAVLLAALLVLAACGEPDLPAATDERARPSVDAAPVAPAAQAQPAPRRALWVLCEGSERVLEHPDRIDRLLADARALGAGDLFVQVFRRGVAWWPSSLASSEPYERMRLPGPEGGDTLALLIERAHAQGIRVHAWVNVLSLAGNRDAAILAELGPGALHVDRRGRSVADYPGLEIPAPDAPHLRMGTKALWIDPAAPGVSAWLAATFAELLEQYPLDGLHLDYIRYPDVLPFVPGTRFGVGLDFGYGAATRQRFREDTGLEAPFEASLANANAWDQWRRERLTELVARIRLEARRARPDVELSAAVWAYAERGYTAIFQDWRGWLDRDQLDFAVPMLYTRDDHLLRLEAAALLGGVAGERVWPGLGVWLFAREPERAAAQIARIRALDAPGLALFSWDSLTREPALRTALAEALDAPRP